MNRVIKMTSGFLKKNDFKYLLSTLNSKGLTVIGPTPKDGAIVYEEIKSVADLPVGLTDEQEKGYYSIHKRSDGADTYFGYAVGPYSWRRYLDPPKQKLWTMEKSEGNLSLHVPEETSPPLCFLGVRACEIKAMEIQDKVFLSRSHPAPYYQKRRHETLIIAVNCSICAQTCFCTSMDSGPEVKQGYDILITEFLEGEKHEFFLQSGSDRGAEIIEDLPLYPPLDSVQATQERIHQQADKVSSQMKRKPNINNKEINKTLTGQLQSKIWDDIAQRCLSCANCTLVCPTCFCSTVEDVTDLRGEHSERWKRWDSCFTLDFSYIHGGSVRDSIKSKYRQWLTHKVGTWHDQFAVSGCVGCGRCITWCPVGIDLTEELPKFQKSFTTRDRTSFHIEKEE